MRILAALVVAEAVIFSVWFDTSALRGRQGLTGAAGDWAPSIVRTVISFAFSWYVFARMEGKAALGRVRVAARPRYAVAHAVAVLISFALLRAVFESNRIAPLTADVLMATALAAASAAVLFAVFAIVELESWVAALQARPAPPVMAAAVAGVVAAFAHAEGFFWKLLTSVTFDAVETILQPAFPVLTDADARRIVSSAFSVVVTTGCSGTLGLVFILVLCCATLLSRRRDFRFPGALLLLPAGLCLGWGINSLRIAVLFAVGHIGASAFSVHLFHSQLTWVCYNAAGLMLILHSRRYGRFPRD